MSCWLLAVLAAAPAGQVLTLEEAVHTAQQHQPQLRQAHAGTQASQARADTARAPLLPQVTGRLGYTRSTANFAGQPGSVPNNPNAATTSFNTYDYFSSGLTLNQLVWDFQSVDRWRAAKANAQSQQWSERAVAQAVLQQVRSAFFAARATHALVKVAVDSLDSQRKHLSQIQGFVEVGTRPEIDLAQARTDVATSKLQLINAENAYATARATLNQAMGVERDTNYDVADDELSEVAGEDGELEGLVDEAVKARPDLMALQQQIAAQELTLSATRGGYWPAFGVSTGITDNGRALDAMAFNWNAGATLSWQLFSGGTTWAQAREADANLESLRAQVDSQRQQVRLDVDKARLAVRSAKAAVEASDEALANAKLRLKLAEGRYETGVGSSLELSDAQVAVTTAGAQRVQAGYNLFTSRAALLQALARE